MTIRRILRISATVAALLLVLPSRVDASTPREWPIKKIVFSNRSEGWIMGTHRLMRSIDGGRSWSDLTDHFEASADTNPYLDEPFFVDIYAEESGQVWLLLIDQLYTSRDRGKSWLLVFDSVDFRQYCGPCGLKQVGYVMPSHVFVLARRY